MTTVPAAGYVAVALVMGETAKAVGSAMQLLLNLAGIVLAAAAVLLFSKFTQRRAEARRIDARPAAARRKPGAPRPERR